MQEFEGTRLDGLNFLAMTTIGSFRAMQKRIKGTGLSL